MVSLKQNKGQALVELAFILPLLLLILMGIVEFGRIFNANLIITNASREGARYASVNSTDEQIVSAITTLTSTLDQSAITITINPAYSNRISGNPVQVQVNYSIDIIAPIIGTITGDPFPITSQTTMRVE